ncbi:hypothetical protein D5274_11055 [bacterium 1XD42-94]|nr:hypothetical protein [bacterium 1XD42-94]
MNPFFILIHSFRLRQDLPDAGRCNRTRTCFLPEKGNTSIFYFTSIFSIIQYAESFNSLTFTLALQTAGNPAWNPDTN